MSWREHDMYASVRRNLRAQFPQYEGWRILVQDRWSGGRAKTYELDLIAERIRRRRIERVVVEVKVTERVSDAHIAQLNRYARNLAGGNALVVAKILVVPCGTDTSLLRDHPDIRVMFLKNFAVVGREFHRYVNR